MIWMEPQANQSNERNVALEQAVYCLSSQQVPDSVLGPDTGYVLESTTNKMQRFLDLFNSVIVLHVSSGSFAHHQEHKTVHTASGIVKPTLLPAAIVDGMEQASTISSTIVAGSSVGLTVPDAICTVSNVGP
jgi:hypothetical protein